MIKTDHILTVDPGLKTGIALLRKEEDEVTIVWSQETDFYETMNLVWNTIHEYGKDLHVVCEDFIITSQTGKKSQQTWSLRLIGAIECLCHQYSHRQPILQTPSIAKNFCPNDRLKALDLWHRGGAGHARDALRHGVLYCVKNLNWRPANLLVQSDET